jgi:hypothetical protein
MATYKQFRLGEVAPAQAGFGLIGPDCRSFNLLGGQHRVPLLSIVYPTEAEAQAARDAITESMMGRHRRLARLRHSPVSLCAGNPRCCRE